jgi:hypothetical protein
MHPIIADIFLNNYLSKKYNRCIAHKIRLTNLSLYTKVSKKSRMSHPSLL